ncbi:MAG: hypothetical protein U0103_05740 [Candidatus Obscuribacterales bacterium]
MTENAAPANHLPRRRFYAVRIDIVFIHRLKRLSKKAFFATEKFGKGAHLAADFVST